MIPPRINVERGEIAAVVRGFYARVRQDPELGPVFASHVQDWPTHEEKITRFWANALLFERQYDGNPMMAHIQAGNVTPEHFPRWLELFAQTLTEEVAPEKAAQWMALVTRIGQGLSFCLRDVRRPEDHVPNLRAS